MKLIAKTQKYYLPLFAAVLLLWGAGFLAVIAWEMNDSAEEALESELEAAVAQLKQSPDGLTALPRTTTFSVIPIDRVQHTRTVFADTLLTEPGEDEREAFRQVSRQVSIGGQPYRVVIRQSQVEYDDLFTSILIALLAFAALLTAAIVVINRWFLQRIWDPFYHTMSRLSSYRISDRQPLSLPQTDIDEFRALNTGVERLIDRIEKDYTKLKQFTENASHEIQTPLSVIQNQIELLMQDQALSETQRRRLGEINQMTGRLSRLNSALLVLTKIENRQYGADTRLNLTALLQELTERYRALGEANEIYVDAKLQPDVQLQMNRDLAEMLFRNLLSNAIKHNNRVGTVRLRLSEQAFTIHNTGPEPDRDPAEFFSRFQKGKGRSDSLGLGLAIVRTITDAYGFDLSYRYERERHIIRIGFPDAT